jgi:2-polyprenyl-3-methyl-5-hydroxy-6-metoxy-1,4-benzoquinol methylase
MNQETRKVLLDLNRRFYAARAAEFSRTRQQPWQGWRKVLERAAKGRTAAGEPLRILDLGCGNGRFAKACARQLVCDWSYNGIDASAELVAEARERLQDTNAVAFEVGTGDLLAPRSKFWSSRNFDLVTLFGVMHHVPSRESRQELQTRAARCVAPGGLLAVSFWQLQDSERLMRRTVEPSVVGLKGGVLEPGDHLLRWGDADAVRYCHHTDLEEMVEMVDASGMDAVESFRADGRGDAMNVYWLSTPSAES